MVEQSLEIMAVRLVLVWRLRPHSGFWEEKARILGLGGYPVALTQALLLQKRPHSLGR